jgi:hypothetical protein
MTKPLLCVALLATIAQAGPDRWLGSWTRGNASLEISRITAEPSRVAVHVTVTTPRGCTGEAAGDVPASELAKSAITLKAGLPDETERECEMHLKLTSDGRLTLDEGSCGALHGAACDFAGTYTR